MSVRTLLWLKQKLHTVAAGRPQRTKNRSRSILRGGNKMNMKKTVALALAVVILALVAIAGAAKPRGVPRIVGYNPGLRKNNTPLPPERSNPLEVLAEGGGFCTLGLGGMIIVKFDFSLSEVLTITEVTGDPIYPPETADVYGSKKGINWILLGEVTNQVSTGFYRVNEITIPSPVKYIKIVDTTIPSDHTDVIADGFDIDYIAGM